MSFISFTPEELFQTDSEEPSEGISVPEVPLFEKVKSNFHIVSQPGAQASSIVLSMINPIFIREEDLQSLMQKPELRKSLTPLQKGSLLKRLALANIKNVFENPSPENIQNCTKVVSQMVHQFMNEPFTYPHVNKLSQHDPYTLQHSVGTAAASIMLGRKVGLSETDLHEIGLAGLLHDIGKIKVRREVINKPGALDPAEWEEMKTHSGEGFRLVENQHIDDRVKAAILEHHEDKNGTGYPYGKHLGGLHLFSKIIGICDVFNALTTDRPYSKAQTPYQAFQIMSSKLIYKLDEKLYRELVLLYGEDA